MLKKVYRMALSIKLSNCIYCSTVILLLFFNHTTFAGSPDTLSEKTRLNKPLRSYNHAPFQDLLAVPTVESAHLLARDQFQLDIQVDAANNFTHDERERETVWLDGEKANVTLRWQKALDDSWQIGIEIPWVCHSEGFMDSLIQDWHQFWSLPNAGREFTETNQLNYSYEKKDGRSSAVDLKSSGNGIGDLRLRLARSLWRQSGRALSMQSQLKLPTGDSKYLRSSGSTDFALGLAFADDASGTDYRLSYHMSGGSIWLGESEILDNVRHQLMAYGNVGIAWRALSDLSLKLQIDSHSAGYDSRLVQLGESVQLVIGGSMRLNDHWLIDLAFSEDLLVNSAPDVSLMLNLSYLSDNNSQ